MNDYGYVLNMAPIPAATNEMLGVIEILRKLPEELIQQFAMPAHLLRPTPEPTSVKSTNRNSLHVWSVAVCLFTFFFVFVAYSYRLISGSVNAIDITGAVLSITGVFMAIYYCIVSFSKRN